jgi:Na+/melibiose symporter-like transporter
MIAAYLQKLRLFNRDARLFLIASGLTGFAVDGIRAVLLNLYLLRLGHDTVFIGQINAVGSLAMSIFCLPAGVLGARWGIRRMLIASLCMMAAGYGLLPLVEFIPTTWQTGWLFTTYILASFGMSWYYVSGIPFLMGVTGSEERSHAFSIQIAISFLAGFAGSLIGGMLPGILATVLSISPEDPMSYRYLLFTAALLLIPGIVALLATGEARFNQSQERVTDKAGRIPYGPIALIMLVVALRFAGRGLTTTFFNVYMDMELDAPVTLIGALSAAGQLLSVPVALATPLLVARWGNGLTIALGSFGIALSILPLALVPHWSAAGLGFIGVATLFSMTTAPIRVYSQEIVAPNWWSTISGALNMGAGLSISVMALGGGYAIASLGYRALFLTGASLTAVGALIFWLYARVPRGELARQSL